MATRAMARPGQRQDARHLMRYLKSQAPGATIEDIARSERVSVATIRESIAREEIRALSGSPIQMDLAIRSLLVTVVPKAAETIVGLLDATELVEVVSPKRGLKRTIRVEDKTTRLEASRLVKDLVIGMQPKVPLVNNTVTQTNQMANLGGSETLEERLRRLRKSALEFNALPPEVAAVPAHIDAGEEAADEEEEEDEDESDE